MWSLAERYEMLAGQVPERELARGNPPWFMSALVATTDAQARLRRWAAQGGFDQGLMFPDDIARRLRFAGDEEIRVRVIAVLGDVAPPVRDHLLETTLVVGVGQSSCGWVAKAPEPGPRLRIMALCGVRDDGQARAVIAHEIAHTWLLPDPPAAAGDDVDRDRPNTMTLAAEWGQLDHLERICVRDERLAAQLAHAWGFRGPATDAERCARAEQRDFRARAAMLRGNA